MSLKKIVAYSFFRHDASEYESERCGEAKGRVFVNYIRLIVRAHHAIWPSWQLRFYHDDRVMDFPYFEAMRRMEQERILELFYVGKAHTLCGSMMWRMKPIFETGVDYVACRDVDSVPLPRDRRAVEEFVCSANTFHVIHDASAHSGFMGGTSAVYAPDFIRLIGCYTWEEFMILGDQKGFDWNVKGCDQHHLNRNIMPLVLKRTLVHELHHMTDVPAPEIRRSITSAPLVHDIHPQALKEGDAFSTIIGGCADVERPFAFYNKLPIKALQIIQRCERA